MASTYPLEIVQAARWAGANSKLKGKALEDALQPQPWDPSVKSIVVVPQVLKMLDAKLDWTEMLGNAFLAQHDEVLKAVQDLPCPGECERHAHDHQPAEGLEAVRGCNGRAGAFRRRDDNSHRHRSRQPAGHVRSDL